MDAAPRAKLIAVFLVMVVPTLWLLELRPRGPAREFAWPGHAQPFRLPEYLPGDCPYYRGAMDSLLHDRDLDLRNNVDWAVLSPDRQVALGRRGEWYPKHSLGLPVAALGFYALAGDAGLLAFNFLQVCLLDVLLLLAARRFASDGVALATALGFALATLLRPAAYNFSPDVLSTLLVFAAYLCLVQRRAGGAGALLGAAVTVKWTHLVFLPLAAIWTFQVLGAKRALRLVLASAPFLVVLALLNQRMFGSPWVTPYDRVGLDLLSGVPHLESSHRQHFDLPFWSGLGAQLFDPQRGLLFSAPLLLLAVPGLAFIWRQARAEAVLLSSFALTQVLLFAPYREWSASSFGHHFLMTAIALGCPAVAACVSQLLGEPRSDQG